MPPTVGILDLYCCKNVTNDGFKNLPPKLHNLGLFGVNVNHITFQNLHNNIEDLSLSNLSINDDDLQHLPKNLRSLTIRSCKNLTISSFKYLPPSITQVEIRDCDQITQKDVDTFLLCSNVQKKMKYVN